MKIEIEVNEQTIKDQIITAIEGGSNYWYYLADLSMIKNKVVGEALSERIGNAVLDEGITVPVNDYEDGGEHLGDLSKESIKKGLELMATKHQYHFSNMIGETGDGETADVFFQLAVMGEVRFG